ncbi:MAG: adenylyl-sulfate kinase [Saprospiraceae bacterium]
MGQENIHPIFDRLLQTETKEKQLNQRGKVIWLIGLSGSGKSTIAQHLEAKLYDEGFLTQVLDGDNIRSGLNKNLTFSADDRLENIRRISEVAKLFANCGVVTLASFITPTEAIRAMAKEIIGEDKYIEVFVSTSLEACENRDVKGLYDKARQGIIKNFTGIDSVFETPQNPAIIIPTEGLTIEESVQKLYDFIIEKISY